MAELDLKSQAQRPYSGVVHIPIPGSVTPAGEKLTLAQKLSRGKGPQREQEDAQEFLTFLLDSAHQELLKLRAMYGTQGKFLASPSFCRCLLYASCSTPKYDCLMCIADTFAGYFLILFYLYLF